MLKEYPLRYEMNISIERYFTSASNVEAAAAEPDTYVNAETRKPLNTQHHRRLCLSTRHISFNCRSSLHWSLHFTSTILNLLTVAGRPSFSSDCTLNCSNNTNSGNNDTKSTRILRAKDAKWKERLHNKLMDFERTGNTRMIFKKLAILL